MPNSCSLGVEEDECSEAVGVKFCGMRLVALCPELEEFTDIVETSLSSLGGVGKAGNESRLDELHVEALAEGFGVFTSADDMLDAAQLMPDSDPLSAQLPCVMEGVLAITVPSVMSPEPDVTGSGYSAGYFSLWSQAECPEEDFGK